MGLKATIQGLVSNAINSALGDLSSTFIFKSVGDAAYNPLTGVVSAAVTQYSCTGVLTSLKQEDISDMSLVATGRKALIPSLELDGVNVDALDDQVVVDGVTYVVHSFKLDPAGALFTFILGAREGMKINANS